MKIKAVLFDLDATLLPMNQDLFIGCYLKGLAEYMEPYGYNPDSFTKSMWVAVKAMLKNDGSMTNEERFWQTFSEDLKKDARKDEAVFEEFYKTKFQEYKDICGYNPEAAETVKTLKKRGYRVVLATNPFFPKIATDSRVRWAGLEPTDFEIYTTYENSKFCKPNPLYYADLLEKLSLSPNECLMVGNDVRDDMIAETVGIKVFLHTDCLINIKNLDISHYPQGSFEELKYYIEKLN